MVQMRVYEIARSISKQDPSVKANDLVVYLREHGFDVKSAQSKIGNDEIVFLIKAFQKGDLKKGTDVNGPKNDTEDLSVKSEQYEITKEHVPRSDNRKALGRNRKPPGRNEQKDDWKIRWIIADEKAQMLEKGEYTDDAGALSAMEMLEISVPKNINEYARMIRIVRDLDGVKQTLSEIGPNDIVHYKSLEIDREDEAMLDELIYGIMIRASTFHSDFEKKYIDADRMLLKSNFEYLLDIHGMEEKDLEAIFSHGDKYYSRGFNPDDSIRRISIDGLREICELFEVSMDRFVNEDLRKDINAGVERVIAFLDKMVDDTSKLKLRWREEEIEEGPEEFTEHLYDMGHEPDFEYDEVKGFTIWRCEDPYFTLYKVELKDSDEYLMFSGDRDRLMVFDTCDDGSGRIKRKCRYLVEEILERKNVFTLSKKAEDAIGSYMNE